MEECAIPDFGAPEQYKLPVSTTNSFLPVIDQYRSIFHSTPGATSAAFHNISTKGPAIRVPPHHVPAHYSNEVE